MDDYSIIRDLLETWRSTTDWVKFVMLVAVPGYLAFFFWLLLAWRTDRRVMIAEDRERLTDHHVRQLVEAEICRIIAEWERTQLSEEHQERLPRPHGSGGGRLQ